MKDRLLTSKNEDKILDSDELIRDNAILESYLLANHLLAMLLNLLPLSHYIILISVRICK